jgi:hypothetical protein
MVEAFGRTSRSARLIFVLDHNDPELGAYGEARASLPAVYNGLIRIIVTVNAPKTMVGALNEAAAAVLTSPDAPYAIGFMGDDHRPRTEGWDEIYLETLFEMPGSMVYGDDGLQGQRLPTQIAMTSDIVRALGYMAPPGLRHLFVDNFWLDLGMAAGGLRYLPRVLIEHMHPVAGKAELDEGYERVNAPEVYNHDQAAYREYLRSDAWPEAVKAVRALHDGPADEVHEWRLFDEGTVPEYTTPEWYQGREHAPHLEQELHKPRLLITAGFVGQAIMRLKIRDRPTRVVDLGAGDGGMLSLLGPAVEAWGYDLMPDNLAAARKRGVRVELANVLTDEIKWGDVAVCTEMLEHLIDPHQFVADVFKRDEVQAFICSSPADERPGRAYEFHTWAWDLDGYRDLVAGAGWNVKRQKQVGMFQVILAVRP